MPFVRPVRATVVKKPCRMTKQGPIFPQELLAGGPARTFLGNILGEYLNDNYTDA